MLQEDLYERTYFYYVIFEDGISSLFAKRIYMDYYDLKIIYTPRINLVE